MLFVGGMNSTIFRLTLFSFLLVLVLAPFAGFAPLLLVLLIAGTYWFISPIARIVIFGDSSKNDEIVDNKN